MIGQSKEETREHRSGSTDQYRRSDQSDGWGQHPINYLVVLELVTDHEMWERKKKEMPAPED